MNSKSALKKSVLSLVGASILLFGAQASAALIASLDFTGGTGRSMRLGDEVGGIGLALLFDPADFSSCIGCSSYLPPESVSGRSYEFSRANSVYFDAFTERLTNTRDELLWTGLYAERADGSMFDIGAGGMVESYWFRTLLSTPDIVTSIDTLRLTIRQLNFSATSSNWFASYSGTWEIFGTPGASFEGPYSTLSPIPEPGTLALLGCGLVGFVVLRRRRARRERASKHMSLSLVSA